MGRIGFTIIASFWSVLLIAQLEPVEVTDLTLKVGGLSTEEMYFGFAEGDEIVFSFEEVKGKTLKEVEIIELPGQSKFMDFKTSSITDKKIKVNKTCVYAFKFINTSVKGKICKVHIQRIPKSEELVGFNTGWEWKTLYDTIYTPYTEDSIIGYDTTYVSYTEKELFSVDTLFMEKSKNERIHTRFNINGDRSVVTFSFPYYQNSKYEKYKTLGWAYWFGTGGAPEITSVVAGASKIAARINPVAGLALGIVTLATTTAGGNLDYRLLSNQSSRSLFLSKLDGWKYYDSGDGSSSNNRFTSLPSGAFYIGFDNDHTYPVDVDVLFTVVTEKRVYKDVEYEKPELKPRYITLNKMKMEIKTSEVRVNVSQ